MASPKTTQTSRRSSSSSPSSSLSSSDVASWYCGAVLLFLILMASVRESSGRSNYDGEEDDQFSVQVRGTSLHARHCDEIYVVGEGETLNTISDKCNDPFIVERNPHIHDPDDVFPGLVIKIFSESRV